MRTPEQIDEIIKCLEEEYPIAECSLQYEVPWQLLFATRLAAQCTDARVNLTTPELFGAYPTLEEFANADILDVERIIKPCGFYHTKAKDLVMSANKLVDDFNGEVPDTMEELTSLPGIGRKTANLILGDVFGQPSYVVDTHCIRLTNRLGIIDGLKDQVKIERKLREVLPPEKSSDFCHRMVMHGRAVCTARKTMCDKCCVRHVCKFFNEGG